MQTMQNILLELRGHGIKASDLAFFDAGYLGRRFAGVKWLGRFKKFVDVLPRCKG